MQTYPTGTAFYPLDPRENEIRIEDIAHALGRVCRFGGHCRDFYSVAEHSVHVSLECAPQSALAGLLHDAAEAYLGDMVRPLKRNMPDFIVAEVQLERVIRARFGLMDLMPASVNAADNALLLAEKHALLAPEPMPWGIAQVGGVTAANVTIRCWTPEQATYRFLERFKELTQAPATCTPSVAVRG